MLRFGGKESKKAKKQNAKKTQLKWNVAPTHENEEARSFSLEG